MVGVRRRRDVRRVVDVVDDVIAEGNRLLELAFRAAAPRVEITR